MLQTDRIFNIAHMCNSPKSVHYAVGCGSNGVEIDITIGEDNELLAYHPGLSDCSVLPYGVCGHQSSAHSLKAVCVEVVCFPKQIQLVYFDVKSEALSQVYCFGNHIKQLFGSGYNGQVIVAVSFFSKESSRFLQEIQKWLYIHCSDICKSVFYTFDDGVGVHQTLDIYDVLSSLVGNQIVMSFGNSALSMVKFEEESIVAQRLCLSGLIAGVFTFTLDRKDSMENAINIGVSGIITNRPFTLTRVLRTNQSAIQKTTKSRIPLLIPPSSRGYLSGDDRKTILKKVGLYKPTVVSWYEQVGRYIHQCMLLAIQFFTSSNHVRDE